MRNLFGRNPEPSGQRGVALAGVAAELVEIDESEACEPLSVLSGVRTWCLTQKHELRVEGHVCHDAHHWVAGRQVAHIPEEAEAS
jgi:hypothetical protein